MESNIGVPFLLIASSVAIALVVIRALDRIRCKQRARTRPADQHKQGNLL
jgi:hypothetical protein